MDLQLKDKVIIVTGGARGIGKGIAVLLAQEGAIPFIISRTEEENLNTVKEIKQAGGKCFQTVAQLTNPAACELAVAEVVKVCGRIDGLVNNAGENDGVGLLNGSYDKFVQSLHKNLIHYYMVAHHAVPELIKTQGSIVNIGSKVADTGQGGTSAYAAANGGRNALTREWAVELLTHKIRVNAVIVAECYTPLYDRWIKTLPNPEEKLASIVSHIPLGKRMTTVEEIASMVAFLLSPVSSHTTGQITYVDGGYTHLDRSI